MTNNKPEVKRYNIAIDKYDHLVPYETEHGMWVKYSSCKDLQAECRILESELATVKKVAYGNVDLLDECEKLVEALELISDTDPDEGTAWFHEIACKALAAYRKGEAQ